jgi:hypothetical protein
MAATMTGAVNPQASGLPGALEAGPFAASLQGVHDDLFAALAQAIGTALERARSDPRSRGSRYAWSWATAAITAIEAYHSTRDERFLSIVADSFEVVLEDRDDRTGRVDEWRGRVVPGWSIHRGGIWSSTATIPGRVTYPAALFARWVERDGLARFRNTAQRFLGELEETVQVYMADAEPSPAGGLAHRNPFDRDIDAFDHINALAATEAVLYDLTGKESYLEAAAGHAAFFHAHSDRDPSGALQWIYRVDRPGKPPRPEPVWKAPETLTFALEANGAGFGFSDDDLRAFASALLTNVLRPEGVNRDVSPGTLSPLEQARKPNQRRRIVMWAMLHEFDPRVGWEIAELVETRPDLVPGGWTGGDFELFAFAHLLDARRPDGAANFAEHCAQAREATG